jgi:hypothetical protein
MCRVSGRTSRSPTFHPETACDSVNVVLPARGSVARRVNVGVFTLPCIDALPSTMMPVPNWSVSDTLPPSGELAMMISAITLAAIGVAAVPTSSTPGVPIPILPAITSRLVTFRRVLTVGANASLPSTTTVYATADVSAIVTAWAWRIRTTLLAVGTLPPCHVEGLDQLPLATLSTAVLDGSCEKSGIFSGSVNAATAAAAACMPAAGTAASTAAE